MSGIPLDSVVRIMYSEPFDPTGFTGQSISVTGPSGAVEGQLDQIFGNTGLVFTPRYPMAEGSAYTVTILPATDLSGNSQESSTSVTFTTTDRTPPVVSAIAVSNGGAVIENSIATLAPSFSGGSDVVLVDWYINGQAAQAVRNAPFAFSFQALPAFGAPGNIIRVTAIATDSSGNRGTGFDAFVTVTPDVPPVVKLTAPASGISAGNCTRVNVHIEATDDVGVAKMAYQAVGGVGASDCQPLPGIPPATGFADVAPPAAAAAHDFAFYIPKAAVPGAQVVVKARHSIQGHNPGDSSHRYRRRYHSADRLLCRAVERRSCQTWPAHNGSRRGRGCRRRYEDNLHGQQRRLHRPARDCSGAAERRSHLHLDRSSHLYFP